MYCLENEQWLLLFSSPLFQIQFPTDSLSYSLSHLNIISSFIIYSFFNNCTSSNIFFIQYLIIIIKKNWRMNSSPSNLMSYCSWAKKKKSGYRESIGEWTVAYFVGLLPKVERILCLALMLEMLLGGQKFIGWRGAQIWVPII